MKKPQDNLKPLPFWELSQKKRHEFLREFAELQTGPNPLTREEVRALYAKRPEVYSALRKW